VTDIVSVKGLTKFFPIKKSLLEYVALRRRNQIRAVDGIDFNISEGDVFTLAGESGCGKTTTGRMLAKLTEPSHGNILFDGSDITHVGGDELRLLRRKIQIIFQDPNASLKVVSSHHKVACHL